MDIFSSFATDETLETKGKWFPLSKTASVLVARKGNTKYKDYLRDVFKDDPLSGLPDDEANTLAEQILLDAEAHTVLLGWKGLTYKGVDLPVNPESAKQYLSLKDFRKKITALSESLEAYRVKEEEAQKND